MAEILPRVDQHRFVDALDGTDSGVESENFVTNLSPKEVAEGPESEKMLVLLEPPVGFEPTTC